MPSPITLPLPVAPALAVAGVLLGGCSHPAPEAATSPAGATVASASPRSSGTRADSLNGIPGHHFGEPLSKFPHLILLTKEDAKGVRVYRLPAGQEKGWFGKHPEMETYYQFQDGQFAMFRVVTTNTDANRTALLEEASYLFGPSKGWNEVTGERNWEGEQVSVNYFEKFSTPLQSWLEVYSKPLLAVQRAKQQAQLQAENAVGN